jgi:hypothetical protein
MRKVKPVTKKVKKPDHSEAQEIYLLRRILETLERIERELKPRIMTPGKPTVQVKE